MLLRVKGPWVGGGELCREGYPAKKGQKCPNIPFCDLAVGVDFLPNNRTRSYLLQGCQVNSAQGSFTKGSKATLTLLLTCGFCLSGTGRWGVMQVTQQGTALPQAASCTCRLQSQLQLDPCVLGHAELMGPVQSLTSTAQPGTFLVRSFLSTLGNRLTAVRPHPRVQMGSSGSNSL